MPAKRRRVSRKSSAAAAAPDGGDEAQAAAPVAPPGAPAAPGPAPEVDFRAVLDLIRTSVDPALDRVSERDEHGGGAAAEQGGELRKRPRGDKETESLAPDIGESGTQSLERVYELILRDFASRPYRDRYGCTQHDLALFKIPPRHPVPSYFANVHHGSIYQRKLLSVLGLRNLLYGGWEIYEELRATCFSSNPAAYRGCTGPERMRFLTGNTVDLDTCVLRCSDGAVLRTVNANNKRHGLPEHRTAADFGRSRQAREMAVAAARPLLEAFCAAQKLSPAQRQARHCDPESLSADCIRVATHNTDRGRHPLWQYINVGQNSFHANVPNVAEIVGSVLRAPYQLAAAYCRVRLAPEGKQKDMLDGFFEDCVVDACFNHKWRAIEEFNRHLASADSVHRKLSVLQQSNQALFLAIYDDSKMSDKQKDRKEVAELWRLARGCTGRDAATGALRPITLQDCKSFCAGVGDL
eukprot:TRINITY_DN12854_c0_g1_i1.p1 TRINITY_DN12854_c0_g1~~TRINITY_DN12854_c0_g1_i1.p1  ORF type:complete len:467 (+),score=103.76 TRINITY_DN12854_c0_g1_i1:74-1474(+)